MTIKTFEPKLFKPFVIGRAACVLCGLRKLSSYDKPRFYIHRTDSSIWVPAKTIVKLDSLFLDVLPIDLLHDVKNNSYLVNIDYIRTIEYTPWLYSLYRSINEVVREIHHKTLKMNAVQKNSFLKHQCIGCWYEREQRRYNEKHPKREMSIEEMIHDGLRSSQYKTAKIKHASRPTIPPIIKDPADRIRLFIKSGKLDQSICSTLRKIYELNEDV